MKKIVLGSIGLGVCYSILGISVTWIAIMAIQGEMTLTLPLPPPLAYISGVTIGAGVGLYVFIKEIKNQRKN